MEVKAGRTDLVDKYFERLERATSRHRSYGFFKRHLAAYGIRRVRKKLLSLLGSLEHTRYSKAFLTRPSVRERFRQYFRYSLSEIERLRVQLRAQLLQAGDGLGGLALLEQLPGGLPGLGVLGTLRPLDGGAPGEQRQGEK